MADANGSPNLSGVGTPFGALELNVFVAGLEALAWLLPLRSALWNLPLLPHLTDTWKWWYGAALFVAVLGLFVLGLAVEGLAGLIEQWITRTADAATGKRKLREWYSRATEYTDAGWVHAQRWIWNSPQASAEFGRRRIRILVAHNTAFNAAVCTVAWLLYLVAAIPPNWGRLFQGTLSIGALLTWLFLHVWTDAHRAFHYAVRDAAASEKLP